MTTIKTVKVSDKGQIAIPLNIRELAGIEKGDELVIIEDKGKIMMEKTNKLKETIEDDFRDLLKHSESVMKKLWDNEEDEIWNTI